MFIHSQLMRMQVQKQVSVLDIWKIIAIKFCFNFPVVVGEKIFVI